MYFTELPFLVTELYVYVPTWSNLGLEDGRGQQKDSHADHGGSAVNHFGSGRELLVQLGPLVHAHDAVLQRGREVPLRFDDRDDGGTGNAGNRQRDQDRVRGDARQHVRVESVQQRQHEANLRASTVDQFRGRRPPGLSEQSFAVLFDEQSFAQGRFRGAQNFKRFRQLRDVHIFDKAWDRGPSVRHVHDVFELAQTEFAAGHLLVHLFRSRNKSRRPLRGGLRRRSQSDDGRGKRRVSGSSGEHDYFLW